MCAVSALHAHYCCVVSALPLQYLWNCASSSCSVVSTLQPFGFAVSALPSSFCVTVSVLALGVVSALRVTVSVMFNMSVSVHVVSSHVCKLFFLLHGEVSSL